MKQFKMQIPVTIDIRFTKMISLSSSYIIYKGEAKILGHKVASVAEHESIRSEQKVIKLLKQRIKEFSELGE